MQRPADSPERPPGNLPEYSVSELSRALKRTVEDVYSYVRVRGEISGFKRAGSGHLYMALKDQDAVIDGVCWRGVASRLSVTPEDGLEVVVTGKLTTYPARSRYQIVIESMELAGEGALLKLLEERRKKLAAEGLFAEDRKRPLPYLPEVIGVVTSPTGAVIRDILHRLGDRFPRRVLIWPVLVQGEGAAEQVAAAIEGFNRLSPDGAVPRPDVLIVARGGGSLEDLWAFNEEVVIRAVAASAIPLISAVGHETDTTLIDFASDRRAPTPTAAAEIAVPVRGDLIADVLDLGRRAMGAMNRTLDYARRDVEGLGRGLPDPAGQIGQAYQRLDDLAERQENAWRQAVRHMGQAVSSAAGRLRSPAQVLAAQGERVAGLGERLAAAPPRVIDGSARRLEREDYAARLTRAAGRIAQTHARHVEQVSRRLEAVSYLNVLKRGYAVVHDAAQDTVLTAAATVPADAPLAIEFHDGRVAVRREDADGGAAPPAPKPAKPASAPARAQDGRQRKLL